ncbi:MAG: RNA ligase/cyclic nucleotide phosphodiesterase [Piptocephalis tieghemiana]|nr:MAG: RNA ligase/cyclic nucleotide phosphodiesterase [Piptocephalis tieghemiana]
MTSLTDDGTLPSPHITAWLVPPKEANVIQLQSWLQQQHPSSPTFQLHLSLLAPLPPGGSTVEQVRQISRETAPFMVHPTGVSTGPEHFKNVLLQVEKTDALDGLYCRLCKAFPDALSPTKTFDPHLSLLYGLHDEEERKRASQEVMEWSGWKGSPWDGKSSFLADQLVLIDCGGTTEDWKLIETIPFGRPSDN